MSVIGRGMRDLAEDGKTIMCFGVFLPSLAAWQCPSTATTGRCEASPLPSPPLDVGAIRGISDGRTPTFPIPVCAWYRKQITASAISGFYQRVSIASYASAGIARAEMSVRPSVTLRYCIKTKKAIVMISSPSESLNILVSRNIWIITKFERGHPERGRFLRLGRVRSGDFGDISTNKPPYLRNGAR